MLAPLKLKVIIEFIQSVFGLDFFFFLYCQLAKVATARGFLLVQITTCQKRVAESQGNAQRHTHPGTRAANILHVNIYWCVFVSGMHLYTLLLTLMCP